MSQLNVSLLGKFCARLDDSGVSNLDKGKVQELFSYLLLYRNRPHCRELLATLLWSDIPTAQSKSYLRRALWQLQSAFEDRAYPMLLLVEDDWIQINPETDIWLDVVQFECAFRQAQEVPGPQMAYALAQTVATAVQLYRSDLLEGWYQEWCLLERERFHQMYLMMLEKLINYCEAQGEYETGIAYGMQILRQDRAQERAHRHLMRLHYLAGNRTEALRQYARCVETLHQELGVAPARRTVALYEQILADRLLLPNDAAPTAPISLTEPSLHQVLQHLTETQRLLCETQRQVQHDIVTITALLQPRATLLPDRRA